MIPPLFLCAGKTVSILAELLNVRIFSFWCVIDPIICLVVISFYLNY